MSMTKTERTCGWVLWATALMLTGMIFFRLAAVYGGDPAEAISGWRIFQERQPLQMGSQWK
jgi:hypothetical protein